MRDKIVLALISAFITPALAQENGISFSHKNWEVVCDNTLTCRAAGYSNEEDGGGSVLLTRKAGPGSTLSGEAVLGEIESDGQKPAEKLTLWINDKSAGELSAAPDGYWRLSSSQTRALINAVKGSGKVEFRGAAQPFILSNEGAYAVLLKMDDVQGRVGTPGAFAKKGNKPESSVPAAVPPPVIRAAKVNKAESRPLSAEELAVLKPRLMAAVQQDECDRLFPGDEYNDGQDDVFTLTPLDDKHAVISGLCWRAAYNEGYGYWLVDSELKTAPVLITTSGSDYDPGVIFSSHKGRGLGDCWGMASWVWDGQTFRQSSEATTGMCRYIRLGGTWNLPTLVTDVQPAP